MIAFVVGFLLLLIGGFAAANSLHILARAVRLWPGRIEGSDAELFASSEFLVRFIGLLVALIGVGIIAVEIIRS